VTASEYSESDAAVSELRDEWLSRCEAARTKVYRALIAMGASRTDAEDALQDGLEAALRAAPATRAEGWLFVVALRTWKRGRWRRRIFHPLASVTPAPERDRDGAIDLLVELARLPERQRAVLVARHVLGLSQNETASALGIAPGTVGSIGHRAIKALRERLGE
jgi:RNA polymerase sigma factor (sigma-70 family)